MLTKNHATLKAEVEAHIAADAVIQGDYWVECDNAVGGRGCFIACLSHSDAASVLAERFGLPEPLVRIAESIFDELPEGEHKAFFAALPDAVGTDGKDLSRVHWQFLAAELRALPKQSTSVQDTIDKTIKGMDLLAEGKAWVPCADVGVGVYGDVSAYAAYAAEAVGASGAAAYAAEATEAGAVYAAESTEAGAVYAAESTEAGAVYAAESTGVPFNYPAYCAARYCARRRQRDTLLSLISSAVVPV